MLNLQNLDRELAGGFIGKVTLHKREEGWEWRKNGRTYPCFLFSYPQHFSPSCMPFFLKQLNVSAGSNGNYLFKNKDHLAFNILEAGEVCGGADAFRQQPGRCRKVSRRDVWWGQSIRTRRQLCFVTSLLPGALSPDKGIVNSHVNLSLLNVQ